MRDGITENIPSKKTLKSASPKQGHCDKCQNVALIVSYGKTLCAIHGLKHLKELDKTKKHGIPF